MVYGLYRRFAFRHQAIDWKATGQRGQVPAFPSVRMVAVIARDL